MGIRGLLKFIRNYSEVRPGALVLSTETKRKCSKDGSPPPEKAILVCDFIAIVFWILDLVYDAKKPSEKYIALYGADFKEYSSRLKRFVELLRHIDIEPVFLWDAPRGSGNEYMMKLPTWEQRTKDTLEAVRSHSRITSYDPKTEVKFGKKIKRPLLVAELVMALQEANVEILTCPGEADSVIAQYMRDHSNVCGVLTNDTDMMLMSGVVAIHYKLFDQRGALKLLEDHIPPDYKIFEVHCGAITPKSLARSLKIDERCLPALSILCDNDFTSILNQEIDIKKTLFGYRHYVRVHEYIKQVIVWIQHNEEACKTPTSFLEIREIAELCEKEPRYIKAIRHSYAFYTRPPPAAITVASSSSDTEDSDDDDDDNYDDVYKASPLYKSIHNDDDDDDDDDDDGEASPLYKFIRGEVISFRIERDCLPVVKNGILWRDEIEQLDEKLPCIYDDVTLPVRKIIYRLLCCPSVTEYGQHKIDKYVQKQVDVIMPCNPQDLHTLRDKLSLEQKISLFVSVMKQPHRFNMLQSFSESLLQIPPTDRVPDMGSLLTCVCFIYSRRNKLIPDEYVTPLLLSCLYCSLGELPPRISSRPGPTGVTISSHFMVILKHARWFLSLLGLHEQLPLPSSVFQPYVYVHLHGTAFKIKQKEKFYGDDVRAKECYNLLCKNEDFKDFQKCICSDRAIDNIGTVAVQYARTRDIIREVLVKKLKM